MNKKQLAQHEANLQSISEQYLDGQPYDQLRLVNEVSFCLAQSAAQMLEAGRRLIVIKEHETHGEFINVVEKKLGMDLSVARRFMRAAAKFMNPTLGTKKDSLLALGKTKLYELMLEDDDDLVELTEGGTVAGLTLDDIDCMSSRELRQKLRDARADSEAKDKVINAKDEKINKLDLAKKKLKASTPDELFEQMRNEVNTEFAKVQEAVNTRLWDVVEQVKHYCDANGLTSYDSFLNGHLAQLENTLADIRNAVEIFRAREDEAAPLWEE